MLQRQFFFFFFFRLFIFVFYFFSLYFIVSSTAILLLFSFFFSGICICIYLYVFWVIMNLKWTPLHPHIQLLYFFFLMTLLHTLSISNNTYLSRRSIFVSFFILNTFVFSFSEYFLTLWFFFLYLHEKYWCTSPFYSRF